MYEASLAQLRRGSLTTARLGLREMLRQYPTRERAPDAPHFLRPGVAGAAPARKSPHRPPWLAGDAAPVPHQRAGTGRALFHRPELRLGESRFRGRLLPRG